MAQLLCKGVKFEWSEKCEVSFQKLKKMLTTAHVLTIPDPEKMYTLYTDALEMG